MEDGWAYLQKDGALVRPTLGGYEVITLDTTGAPRATFVAHAKKPQGA